MSLPPQAQDWMKRAELDYVGPFVKAWAAFNAWYRHSSNEVREREMLEHVKHKLNAVRRAILSLLEEGNTTKDSLALRQAVFELHQCLDDIHFEISRDGVVERISFRSVCIGTRPLQNRHVVRRGIEYRAQRLKGGAIRVTVTSKRKGHIFDYTQQRYSADEVYARQEFRDSLTETQRRELRDFYGGCNPRPMRDLIHESGPPLNVASMEFRCRPEELLAGLVEVTYAMRNALLHGEVEPDRRVLLCYEPAYRLVMRFLACVG